MKSDGDLPPWSAAGSEAPRRLGRARSVGRAFLKHRRTLSRRAIPSQGGVAATLCHRTPRSPHPGTTPDVPLVTQRVPPGTHSLPPTTSKVRFRTDSLPIRASGVPPSSETVPNPAPFPWLAPPNRRSPPPNPRRPARPKCEMEPFRCLGTPARWCGLSHPSAAWLRPMPMGKWLLPEKPGRVGLPPCRNQLGGIGRNPAAQSRC